MCIRAALFSFVAVNVVVHVESMRSSSHKKDNSIQPVLPESTTESSTTTSKRRKTSHHSVPKIVVGIFDYDGCFDQLYPYIARLDKLRDSGDHPEQGMSVIENYETKLEETLGDNFEQS